MLTRIAVVVPAHDEQDRLPACLASISRAAARLPGVRVEVVVVADGCADDTAGVAAAAGAQVVPIDARCVGVARAAGIRHALRDRAADLWLAGTDADSVVPAGWLGWHHRHALRGTEFLAGTVAVADWSEWPDPVRIEYDQRYLREVGARDHRHVHGANLGCAAGAYEAVGGFPALASGEDRALIARAARAGRRVVHDPGCPVITSARRVARAPAGFAGFIADLAAPA